MFTLDGSFWRVYGIIRLHDYNFHVCQNVVPILDPCTALNSELIGPISQTYPLGFLPTLRNESETLDRELYILFSCSVNWLSEFLGLKQVLHIF